ncbi:hypothetical protein TraAM80_02046 [Trypanosoma rangeli]|uniref:Uncharacterized protein n=1 Tax=Trypanosoma rangeli TaxID=5698 RepID=A0A422NW66_TRYRA|nr:uncharacterized protein TraAM80_02046 [Trypanosoma rangeli]RNF09691.1 hypothetical protein TraAM80_02046 [Trypanosoma rangeli]|eukprot:RNF09691.1 hypothetical protein TraAM80_02046 [Trypanosoma rangeli]
MTAANGEQKTPVVLRDTLFMWDIVASFSAPQTVCVLERLCRDVHETLAFSSTGTRLLQRYWNAQYHKLIWEESHIDPTRLTLDFALTRSEGRRSWKKMYREEYPLYVARTLLGKGANNNALNMAKVCFKVDHMNELLSGEELAKLELTPQEALARRVERNLVSLEGEEVRNAPPLNDGNGNGAPQQNDAAAQKGSPHHSTNKKGRRKGVRAERHEARKGPALGLSRDDYNNDRRLSKHREKHKKGRVGRWSAFAGGEGEDD